MPFCQTLTNSKNIENIRKAVAIGVAFFCFISTPPWCRQKWSRTSHAPSPTKRRKKWASFGAAAQRYGQMLIHVLLTLWYIHYCMVLTVVIAKQKYPAASDSVFPQCLPTWFACLFYSNDLSDCPKLIVNGRCWALACWTLHPSLSSLTSKCQTAAANSWQKIRWTEAQRSRDKTDLSWWRVVENGRYV